MFQTTHMSLELGLAVAGEGAAWALQQRSQRRTVRAHAVHQREVLLQGGLLGVCQPADVALQ